jgi:hypothetical protein
MTQPGYVAPAAPGWWVRTNRIGIAKPGYDWAVTATATKHPVGTASGAYTWDGSATGYAMTLIGTNVAADISVPIPTHKPGDLIIVAAYNSGNATAAAAPAAGGTVPAWVTVDANTGGDLNAMGTFQFVATGNNTTTGIWTGMNFVAAAVVRGQFTTPIGGHSESGSTSLTQAVAPSITMTNSDGSSILLEFLGHRIATAWGPAPAGYTQQSVVATTGGLSVLTKDDTTSDGAATQLLTSSILRGYRGATVEIRRY